jgi:prophage antirepressor-like protein
MTTVSLNTTKNDLFKNPYEIKYNNSIITYFKYNDILYFKGKCIAIILGYAKASYVIGSLISKADKILVSEFLTREINENLKIFLEAQDPKTIYITYNGAKNLLKNKNNNEFNKWFVRIYNELSKKSSESLELNMSKFTYKYNTIFFICFSLDDTIYFKGKEIAIFLEYEDPDKAIRTLINDLNKYTFILNEKDGNFLVSRQDSGILRSQINDVELSYFLKIQNKKTIYISEAGLYELIFHSKKPQAIQFKQWVVSEVLPSIRKTGKYENNQLICSPFAVGDAANIPCVYIIHIKNNLYKFGKSENVIARLNNHKLKLEYENIIEIYKFSSIELMDKFEVIIKEYTKTKNINRKIDKGIEFFETNDIREILKDFNYKYKEITEEYKDKTSNITLLLEQEKTKHLDREIELTKQKIRLMDIELEIKKLEFELIKYKTDFSIQSK